MAAPDVQARLAVFRCHWQQALAIMDGGSTHADDVNAVWHYAHQMALLLAQEEPPETGVLSLMLSDDVLTRLMTWAAGGDGQLTPQLLSLFDLLLSQAHHPLLLHSAVVRPLLRLLSDSAGRTDVEDQLVTLLHQLGITCVQHPQVLELLFDSDQGSPSFLVFSLLVPFTHREGASGQMARDTLLLLMSLSAKHDKIGQFIAHVSNFCPVLATGLSGLYSSLPQKLDELPDDWHRLSSADVASSADLIHFLNSLEFCNAVVQVAHKSVADQLLSFIYNGFLVPVLGPALHQDILKLPLSLVERYYLNSMDEVIAATAYLDLFLRRITEPSLMRIFLQFVVSARYDDVIILESLVSRIASTSRLCSVSLSLFNTLVDLNCEDVMYQLVFRYLVPCSHVMLSQRAAVRQVDMYGRTADKLLALTPICPRCTRPPPGGSTAAVKNGISANLRSSNSSLHMPPATKNSTKRFYFRRKAPPKAVNVATPLSVPSLAPMADDTTGSTPTSSYRLYLSAARARIQTYADGCDAWTAPYDGQSPAPTPIPRANISPHPECPDGALSPQSPPAHPSPESLNCDDDALSARCTNSHPDDNFGSADLEAFLLSLRGVEGEGSGEGSGEATDMETSLREMDELMDSKLTDCGFTGQVGWTDPPAGRTDRPASQTDQPASQTDHLASRTDQPASQTDQAAMDDASSTDTVEMTHHPITEPNAAELPGGSTVGPAPAVCDGSEASALTNGVGPDAPSGSEPKEDEGEVSHASPDSSPIKTSAMSPDIGPFLTLLLLKLDTLLQNSLYVNLLLTGLLTRLACHPQPLLRSFLLNHSLVFQPCVKSMSQIISSVKHKIVCFAFTHKDFDSLVAKAREFLAWREIQTFGTPPLVQLPPITPDTDKKERKRGSSLSNFLFRRGSQHSPTPLQLHPGGGAVLYTHRLLSSPTPYELTSPKTKNCVYAALVLDEFLQELAAVSQEHALLKGEPLDMPPTMTFLSY